MGEQATRIQLCGPLVVRLARRRVEADLTGRQLRLLFVFLVLSRVAPAPRDRLVDAVWGDYPPPSSEVALSSLLSKLRRSLGPSLLVGRSEVRLALPADAWVDYEAAVLACHRAESSRAKADWVDVFAAAKLAYYIARRGFLPGEDLSWVREYRRSLEEILLTARECDGEASLGLGGAELPAAVRAGRELMERAPYRETGYRILMEALAAQGNVAEALRVYDGLRVLLADELGVAPGAALQRFHERLLREGDP